MSKLIEKIKAKASSDIKRIVLPEGDEKRTVQAAAILKKDGIAEPVLIGNPDSVNKTAAEVGADITGIEIIDPASSDKASSYADTLYELRKAKGVTPEDAVKLVAEALDLVNNAVLDTFGHIAGTLSFEHTDLFLLLSRIVELVLLNLPADVQEFLTGIAPVIHAIILTIVTQLVGELLQTVNGMHLSST